jgi:16S rRNA (guanine1516-N2)-methyltransferase
MPVQRFLACRELAAAAAPWSARLQLPAELYDAPLKEVLRALPEEGCTLVLDAEGLGVYALDLPGSGAVRVQLEEGALGWRIAAERARHEAVVRACGLLKATSPLTVFDATAGLLRDACVLAAAGAKVVLAERSAVIAALIEDGLARAAQHAALQPLLAQLEFRPGDAREQLAAFQADNRPDVVYLDPMFPHRDKSALVKKEMRVFRAVVGDNDDADALLDPALQAARKRVVVKRPRGAPVLDGRKPALVLEGKSSRFDIYLV